MLQSVINILLATKFVLSVLEILSYFFRNLNKFLIKLLILRFFLNFRKIELLSTRFLKFFLGQILRVLKILSRFRYLVLNNTTSKIYIIIQCYNINYLQIKISFISSFFCSKWGNFFKILVIFTLTSLLNCYSLY